MNIGNYYCPQTNDFHLLGNFYNPKYSAFIFTILKWSGTDSKGNPCQSDAQIQYALSYAYLDVPIVNSYFEGNDYSTPIKYYLDDRLFDFPLYGYRKEVYIYLSQDAAMLEDNIYSYSSNQVEVDFNGKSSLILFHKKHNVHGLVY